MYSRSVVVLFFAVVALGVSMGHSHAPPNVMPKQERHRQISVGHSLLRTSQNIRGHKKHSAWYQQQIALSGQTDEPEEKAVVAADPGHPEQGFEGGHVQHEDHETVTSDWRQEYGPKRWWAAKKSGAVHVAALSGSCMFAGLLALIC